MKDIDPVSAHSVLHSGQYFYYLPTSCFCGWERERERERSRQCDRVGFHSNANIISIILGWHLIWLCDFRRGEGQRVWEGTLCLPSGCSVGSFAVLVCWSVVFSFSYLTNYIRTFKQCCSSYDGMSCSRWSTDKRTCVRESKTTRESKVKRIFVIPLFDIRCRNILLPPTRRQTIYQAWRRD